MNSYFASCEQQDRPELRGRPVGVAPLLAETTCCIAASYEAKCSGVKTGTKVADARLLCPNIEIVAARPRLYRSLHSQIVAAVEMVVPVHEVLSVDEMTIRPWENEAALVDALRLGQQIQDAIRYNVGEWMTCSIGLAPNAFLAKVASDLQKPRGLSVLSPDDIPHKLYGLKLTDWPGVAGGMQRRFQEVGVTTTAEMYRLTLPEMRQVFGGINGERWWHQIRGHAVLLPPTRRGQVGHSNVLAPEFRTPRGAWSIASRLLEKAAERLRDERLHASRLVVSVSGFQNEGWVRKANFQPCNRTFQLLGIMQDLWQHTVRRPLHVNVALQDLLPDAEVTPNLFENPRRAKLDAMTDGLNRRFGRGAVTVASSLMAKEYLNHERIPFGKPTGLR